jgi:NitT/TauT family transport system substrate-binding protein
LLNRILPPIAAAVLAATPALAQDTEIQFALDWKFEGPAAPYFVAIDNGYFAEAGPFGRNLRRTGLARCDPEGRHRRLPDGLCRHQQPDQVPRPEPRRAGHAVMMIYDKPPFAIVGRVAGVGAQRSRRLRAGRAAARWRLGAVPDLRRESTTRRDAITVEPVGFPTREPMLAEGNVDAVTGFSTSPPT